METNAMASDTTTHKNYHKNYYFWHPIITDVRFPRDTSENLHFRRSERISLDGSSSKLASSKLSQ